MNKIWANLMQYKHRKQVSEREKLTTQAKKDMISLLAMPMWTEKTRRTR